MKQGKLIDCPVDWPAASKIVTFPCIIIIIGFICVCLFVCVFVCRCHLIQARPGTMLSDVLMNSPVMVGEDGVPIGMGAGSSAFDLSMDPMAADDPELAMVSIQ